MDVTVKDEDLPGPTRYKVACARCGQVIRDRREVIKEGRTFCKPCADDVYFKDARDINWPDMNWKPEKTGRQKKVRDLDSERRKQDYGNNGSKHLHVH